MNWTPNKPDPTYLEYVALRSKYHEYLELRRHTSAEAISRFEKNLPRPDPDWRLSVSEGDTEVRLSLSAVRVGGVIFGAPSWSIRGEMLRRFGESLK